MRYVTENEHEVCVTLEQTQPGVTIIVGGYRIAQILNDGSLHLIGGLQGNHAGIRVDNQGRIVLS